MPWCFFCPIFHGTLSDMQICVRWCANISPLHTIPTINFLSVYNNRLSKAVILLACTQTHKFTKEQKGDDSHRIVSSVFLLFSGWFCWRMDNTNAQMHKCANSFSRLIHLLNKI
jgi:hypothetical protein